MEDRHVTWGRARTGQVPPRRACGRAGGGRSGVSLPSSSPRKRGPSGCRCTTLDSPPAFAGAKGRGNDGLCHEPWSIEHSGARMSLAVWILAVIAVSLALAFLNAPGWAWLAAGAVATLAGLGAGVFWINAF